jgi:hypothetical protein
LLPEESETVGVGSSTTEGSIRSPEVPRWFGPPFVPSVARGVGNRVTVVRRSLPPSPWVPAPNLSEAVGVGSRQGKELRSGDLRFIPAAPGFFQSRAFGVGRPGEDEDPESGVGGADVGSA